MSTGCNCEFIETSPGTWYYVLEHYSAPKNAWDWREHASCYGPFATRSEALDHLGNNHANPGSFTSYEYREGDEPDEVMLELMKQAEGNTQRRSSNFWLVRL